MEERKDKINSKKALVDELIKLVEDIRGDLRAKNTLAGLREFKIDTDNDAVDIQVDKNVAQPGNYQLEVVQLAQKSSAMTSGFATPDDTYVGVGYIKYFLPNGESKDIFVDPDNATLEGVARLINNDPENGLRATVVNDGSGTSDPFRMIVSLTETGDENKARFPYLYFVDGERDFYLEFERQAQDAKIKVDGFEIEVPKNKVSDIIPGVTIDLKKAKPGEEFSVTVGEDTQAITEKGLDLIDKINAVLKFVLDQNAIDDKTDTSRTLGGDITLQQLESRIRNVILSPVMTEEGPRRMSDIGVSFQRNGLLKVDDKKLGAKIAENFKMVSQVLTGWIGPEKSYSGVIDKLLGSMDTLLRRPNGLLHGRKSGLDSKIDQIDRQIDSRQRMLEQRERLLKDKFARLESSMNRIRAQGAGLSAIAQGGASPVQQLG